jgi:hypothetical protein
MTNKLDHSLPSQMHDVPVRGLTPTNRVSNRVKWNGLRPAIFERGDFDGLIDVSNHVISKPREHVFAQHASRPAFEL